MTLIRTSLLNGVAVAVKVASAIVLNKILAVYVGPAGYAIVGQFQNAISILFSLSSGIFAPGVTKLTAQHHDNVAMQHAVWQTAVRLCLCGSAFAAAVLLLFANYLSVWLLNRTDMASVFAWVALALPAIAANTLLMAIVNGKKEIGIYVSCNIIGSVISMVLTGLLTYKFGLYGALVAFTINPALVLLPTALLVARRNWLQARFLWGKIHPPAFRALSGFGLMGLTSALAVPASYMLIRDDLSNHIGLAAAGYWQASWKISELYLMLVTSTLSVYYLPRLAEIRTAKELKTEILKIYRFVMPIVVMAAASIFFLRDFIIYSLFTPDFLPMRELFAWQLLGDVVKIASWILGYVLLGRAIVFAFVLTEILFSGSFVLLSWLLVREAGLMGVSIAYAANYVLYFIAMWVLVSRELRRMS